MYLQVGETADYVGVSAQTLRRWDRDGRLTAVRRPGSSYRYYRRADLEPFRLEYRRASEAATTGGEIFTTANANIEANDLLREPQREAHRAVREHFAESGEPAIIVIPVGCGKTGIIATLPFGIARGRVLAITPNLTIRKGVTDALDISSRECFWARTRVLSDFWTLTNEIVQEVPRIRARQALGDVERASGLIRENLRSGTDNIDARDVQTLMAHDRMEELLSMATSPGAAGVKQRQIAVALVDLGRVGDAARIGEVMQNRAEVRTVCTRIVERIPRGATAASDEWEALDRLHPRLGRPQRRDVLEVMDRCGVAPLGLWAEADTS